MGREHHKRHREEDDTTAPSSGDGLSPSMEVNAATGEDVQADNLKQQLQLVQQHVDKLQSMKLQYLPHQSIHEGTSDPLTSYELEVLRNENAFLKRQLFNMQQQHDPKQVLQQVEVAKKMKIDNDQLLQDNQQLQLQLQDMQHLLQKIKEDCINEKKKSSSLQEDNHRLSSQVFLWQQMHLSSNNATTQMDTSQYSSSQNEYKEEEDLPDVELQSSPVGSHGGDSPVLPTD